MSKKKITIAFKNIYQLWNFAQKIRASNIQIITGDMILICDCSDSDLELLTQYNGHVISEYLPIQNQKPLNQN